MRRFPTLVGLCLLTLLGPVAVNASADESGTPHADPYHQPGMVEGTRKPQTSDGVVGQIAPGPGSVLPLRPTSPRRDTAILREWDVVPGVRAVVWRETTPRGPIRAYLLTVNLRARGVSLDFANNGPVKSTAPVKTMVQRDHAVAGVNADFFDIGDTGAPLGVAKDRQRGLLNGRKAGWNSAFYITRDNRAEIGTLPVTTVAAGRPGLRFTNYNSPSVAPGGIGVYTKKWGTTSGYRVTDGQRKKVRMVLLRRGKVVRNSVRLPSGTTIAGTLLIGRGNGAASLAKLRKGTKVDLTTRVAGSPKMAITGNKVLLKDGLIDVVDDREMHPRTAIGIDRDTHSVLLLVIDGRQKVSRGYTMVELANKMMDLGADEALNLDGGGSSTLVARNRTGALSVINSPSDGVQRSVANAVVVHYRSGARQGRKGR